MSPRRDWAPSLLRAITVPMTKVWKGDNFLYVLDSRTEGSFECLPMMCSWTCKILDREHLSCALALKCECFMCALGTCQTFTLLKVRAWNKPLSSGPHASPRQAVWSPAADRCLLSRDLQWGQKPMSGHGGVELIKKSKDSNFLLSTFLRSTSW